MTKQELEEKVRNSLRTSPIRTGISTGLYIERKVQNRPYMVFNQTEDLESFVHKIMRDSHASEESILKAQKLLKQLAFETAYFEGRES